MKEQNRRRFLSGLTVFLFSALLPTSHLAARSDSRRRDDDDHRRDRDRGRDRDNWHHRRENKNPEAGYAGNRPSPQTTQGHNSREQNNGIAPTPHRR